jgi:hypothetical protein
MNNGEPKSLDRQALKRKYLECFNVRTTNADTWREVVTSLIDCGVSRHTLINWGEYAGYSRITVASTVSRILCSMGLRERREGAGRKPSHEALVLLDHAREQYGERALKVLRAAFRAGRAEAMTAKNLRGTVEIGGNKHNIGTTIRRFRRPAKRRLQRSQTTFQTDFNATIKSSRRTRPQI